jgi:hypothetical protein
MTRSLSDGETALQEDRRIDEEAALRESTPTEAELRQEYAEAAGREAGWRGNVHRGEARILGYSHNPPRAAAEVYADLVRLWEAR